MPKFALMNRQIPPVFPPQRVALVGKYDSPDNAEALALAAAWLAGRGVTISIESATAERLGAHPGLAAFPAQSFDEIGRNADLAVVLGGDGTMLSAARRLARFGVPLVGVNQGRLGFLTDLSRQDMLIGMEKLLAGEFRPETRMLLEGQLWRGEELVCDDIALNDVVIDKGGIGRMIELELGIDGEFVCSLRADGLILSTPTGSTAYSLSAGGPIMHPCSTGIVLVPMSPHALTNRPIVINDGACIEVRIAQADDARVHFDGQSAVMLNSEDRLRVRRAPFAACLLHPPCYSYFAMLRRKLQWSERPSGH